MNGVSQVESSKLHGTSAGTENKVSVGDL